MQIHIKKLKISDISDNVTELDNVTDTGGNVTVLPFMHFIDIVYDYRLAMEFTLTGSRVYIFSPL